MPSGYENPLRITYSVNAVNFGSGNSSRIIRGPKGKRGRLVDCVASVTTSFTGTTSPGAVQLGPSGSLTALLNMPFGSAGAGTAAGNAVNAANVAGAIKGQDPMVFPWTYAAADTDLTLGFIAPVGTPAGVADVHVTIEWF